MEYAKPFLTYDQQADLLIDERGMVADRDDLLRCLKDVGYYRLSGYWHIFKKRDSEAFWENTTFDRVWDAYLFDRQLRLAVFDAIERVEVYMRTQLAYLLAESAGPFGFLDASTLPRLNRAQYKAFIEKCHSSYDRAKEGEPFAKHFNKAYGDAHSLPPYWMLVNVMDFGMVVTLYKGAPVVIRAEIAESLGVKAAVLDSWLVAINTVRNICAHHGRLWNRILGNPPKIPQGEEWHEPYEIKNDKVFGVITILSYLLERVAPETPWREEVLRLVKGRSSRDQERMGFLVGWESSPLWAKWV